MTDTTPPAAITTTAAEKGYKVSPQLLNLLSALSGAQVAILLHELFAMYPDVPVLNLMHLSDVQGEVILCAEVPA